MCMKKTTNDFMKPHKYILFITKLVYCETANKGKEDALAGKLPVLQKTSDLE